MILVSHFLGCSIIIGSIRDKEKATPSERRFSEQERVQKLPYSNRKADVIRKATPIGKRVSVFLRARPITRSDRVTGAFKQVAASLQYAKTIRGGGYIIGAAPAHDAGDEAGTG